MLFRFGGFEADRGAYRASRQGVPLDLTPKLLDLLFYLLERPGQLVTKEELLDSVWPGANVTDNALAQAVSDLREALDDHAASPTFIRTIARRGYRFIAPVDAAPAALSPRSPAPSGPAATPVERAGPGALAVMKFENLANDPEVGWLGAGIAETVTSDLAALNAFRVVDRWRVVEAERSTSGAARDVSAAIGASLMVTGGFQRRGSQLRITARLTDLTNGNVIADAKVDGRLEDVFVLQDGIVRAFARGLGLPMGEAGARIGTRETTSLEAYRAYIEGWLKIESLDVTQNVAASRDFERASAADPKYAIAYSGLATAELFAFENSRSTRAPAVLALRSGIEHARHAIHLDAGLAEAHATLSFLLTSAMQFEEARRAAQQAVSIEPGNWRHQYRLGHANWGEARLRAFERALTLYPQLAYARFETAMVHVARGNFDAALDIVQQGTGEQDRQSRMTDRFPAVGFHWLFGALRAARGDHEGALAAFDREVEQADQRRLYSAEYAAAALVSRGHATLQLGRFDESVEAFTAALTLVDGHARALLGLAIAREKLGKPDARRHLDDARRAVADLHTQDREIEWLFASACEAAADNQPEQIAAPLGRLLDGLPPSAVAWTIPIEPAFLPFHAHAAVAAVLARVAERAR